MDRLAELLLAIGSLCALAVAFALLVVGWRVSRLVRERVRASRAAPVHSILLAVAVADERPDAELDELAALDAGTWRAVEPQLLALLGKLRGSARDWLVDLLRRRGTETAARALTRSRLARRRAVGADRLGLLASPQSVADLLPLLVDRNAHVRQVAARALSSTGAPAAAAPLLGCLVGRRRLPYRIVGQALLGLGAPAVPTLLAAVADPEPLIAATAIEVLGLDRVVAAGRPLVGVLTDGSGEVRIRAARALGRIGTPTAVRPLLAAVEPGQPTSLRVVALGALAALGDPDVVAPLARLLAEDDTEPRVATAAAGALAGLGDAGEEALGALAGFGGPGAPYARAALATAALARARVAPRVPVHAGHGGSGPST